MTPSSNDPLVLRHRVGGYSAYGPPPDLARSVENFWTYLLPAGFTRAEGAMHRVLPDPAVSVALCCRRDGSGHPSEPRVLLIGEKTRPTVFTYERGREIAAVRIKVEWADALLGVRPFEHQDTDVDLAGVLPGLARELLDGLAGSRSPAGAIRTLRDALGGRRDTGSTAPAVVTGALDLVRSTRGCCPVETIARHTGFSVRHLRRLVSQSTGVSLKAFARTRRFVAAITAADAAAQPHWARIAADAGFYDQPHLVRDCRDICGMTPVELHRERRAQVVKGVLEPRAPDFSREVDGRQYTSRSCAIAIRPV